MPSPNERSDTLSEAGEGLESEGNTDGRAHEGTYSMALGNAEEAPQDLETIGRNNSSAEGHNLLQRKMQRIARNRNLSEETFSRLSPPGNPYVLPLCPNLDGFRLMNLRKGTFEQSLLLKPDRMDFVKLMQRWDNNPLKLQLPEDLEARPIALQFLAHSLADWNDDVQHLHIYTDGSFSPDMQVASFSFAVFGWNPSAEEDKSTFSGWLADVVCLVPTLPIGSIED